MTSLIYEANSWFVDREGVWMICVFLGHFKILSAYMTQDSEALKLVAQRGGPIPGDVQDQIVQGSKNLIFLKVSLFIARMN